MSSKRIITTDCPIDQPHKVTVFLDREEVDEKATFDKTYNTIVAKMAIKITKPYWLSFDNVQILNLENDLSFSDNVNMICIPKSVPKKVSNELHVFWEKDVHRKVYKLQITKEGKLC